MGKLDDLVVDEEELSEELLHDILSPFVRIGRRDGSILPNSRMNDLTSDKQVLIVLLALKVMKELGMRDSEKSGPTEISKLSGIKRGTVLPVVRELYGEDLVLNEGGKYYVPNYNLAKVKEFVLGDDA